MADKDIIGVSSWDEVEQNATPVSSWEQTEEKKSPVTNASSEPVQQPTTPSVESGTKLPDTLQFSGGDLGANQIIMPTQAEQLKSVVEPQVYRAEQTKKLMDVAVKKRDSIAKNAADLKSNVNAVEYASQFPELKQIQAIDEQLAAIGEPNTQEKSDAYNALINQRNGLLENEVADREVFLENKVKEIPEPSSFETAGDYVAYQKQVQKEFQDFETAKKKFEGAKALYAGKTKLKDVLTTANESSAKAQKLGATIQQEQREADLAIKTAHELNKDKLEPLGFFSGFADGMEQTTLANTIADLYFTGNEENLSKALENIYVEGMVFPKETTNGGAVGQVLGGQVKPFGVAVAGSALNPAVGVVAGTGYYGRMGAGSGLIDAYTTARSQGLGQTEALELAKKQAIAGGMGGLIEGAAGAITMGGKPLAELAKLPFKTAVKEALQDNAIDAVVAGVNQVVQNKNLQRLGLDRDTEEGVLENMGAELAFGAGMSLAMYGGSKIKGYGTIINGLAKLPTAEIQTQVDAAVKAGTLDAARAQQFVTDVAKSKEAQEKLNAVEIPEEVEDEAIELQKEIDGLEVAKKNASPAVVPAIENQIESKVEELQVVAAIPLSTKEAQELNKLQTVRDSNAEYDAKRLDALQRRQEAVNNQATKQATELETAQTFIDQHALQGSIQKNDYRPDFGMNSEELTRGIEQVKNGQTDKVAAKKVIAKVKEWQQQGYVDMIAGSGGSKNARGRTNVPFDLSDMASDLTNEQIEELPAIQQSVTKQESEHAKFLEDNGYIGENGDLNVAEIQRVLADPNDPKHAATVFVLGEDIESIQNILNDEIKSIAETTANNNQSEVSTGETENVTTQTTADENDTAPSEGTDGTAEGATILQDDTATPDVEQGATNNPEVATDVTMDNGTDIPVENSELDSAPISDVGDSDLVEKTIVNKRAYQGEFREGVKKELERIGLTREVESQTTAKANALEFIDTVGEDAALDAVRSSDVQGAAGAYVWAELAQRIENQILTAIDPIVISDLEKKQAALLEEFGNKALSGGRFASALNDIYQNSDLGYNVEAKINEYKEQNFGEIPPDVEQRFRQYDAELKEVRQKLAEAELKTKTDTEQKAFEDIKDSVGRKKKTYAQRSKEIADQVRKLKTKPFVFKDENGNDIQVKQQGLLDWNELVELGAKAIEASGRVADGISVIISNVADTDWYKALSDNDKTRFAKQLEASLVPEYKLVTEDGKLTIPHQLLRDLVQAGAKDVNELTTQVMELAKADFPNITEREVRDAITNYGRKVNLNKEQVEADIRKMKRIGRVVSGIEDVQNKMRPLRSGQQRDKLSAEERALNKQLRELMKDLPESEADLENQLSSQLDRAKSRTQNRIEDLQREIANKELTPKTARTVQADEELQTLQRELEDVKKEHEALFKDDDFRNKQRLELAKNAAKRRIADLQERLANKDFTKTTRTPLVADTKLSKLRADKLRIQQQYDKEFEKAALENRTKLEKIKDGLWDLWALPRLLRATGELSFVGVQGLVQLFAHPITSAKAFKSAMQQFASVKRSEEFINNVQAQEWYPLAVDSKLAITKPDAKLNAREELFYSGYTDLLWNALGTPFKSQSEGAYSKWKNANPFKAFERAAVGYLDTVRIQRFLDGVEVLKQQGKTYQSHPQEYKAVADVVNTLTGRGSLGIADRSPELAEALTKVFFSPRNWSSMLKTASPYAPIYFGKVAAKSPTAAKMGLADLSKFLGITTGMVMMAAAAFENDDDPETEVIRDPTNSDFGKLKIGNKVIDPWGGRIQQVILAAKLWYDSVNKNGKDYPLGTPFKSPTRRDLLLQQAFNKLNPAAALMNEYLASHRNKEGERVTQYGKEYDPTADILGTGVPITYETIAELYQDDPNALNGLLSFYAFMGGGVDVRDKDAEKKSASKPKPRPLKK